MGESVAIRDAAIRSDLAPGDLGCVVHMHGRLYGAEYGYGIPFETYVAAGIQELYRNYDPARDRVWICEHQGRIVGSLFLVHRENAAAQLRYFLIEPPFRGIGLGGRLMDRFMASLAELGYRSCFPWTTHELAGRSLTVPARRLPGAALRPHGRGLSARRSCESGFGASSGASRSRKQHRSVVPGAAHAYIETEVTTRE